LDTHAVGLHFNVRAWELQIKLDSAHPSLSLEDFGSFFDNLAQKAGSCWANVALLIKEPVVKNVVHLRKEELGRVENDLRIFFLVHFLESGVRCGDHVFRKTNNTFQWSHKFVRNSRLPNLELQILLFCLNKSA
jgi:hypothetical protein